MIKPKPGTIGLSIIGGFGGKLINVGQALHGDPSGWTHAFVVVEFFLRLGIPLFDDGRLPMDVTPGDLHIQWTKALSLSTIEGRVIFGYAPTDNTPISSVDPLVSEQYP
jgi:hypothetical protein